MQAKVIEGFKKEYENCLNLVVNQHNPSEYPPSSKYTYMDHQESIWLHNNSSNDIVFCNSMKFKFDQICVAVH